ncbi:MAG: DNA-binding HxlR family transcriptional regulator [bacterium]|jgi:DNA-binding HxlR family transcriptional regulator
MRWKDLKEEPCSIARTLSVIGDRWTLLILRNCFLRVRRFDDFQKQLGITRHLLADRLKRLVSYDILKKEQYQERPVRYEYRLTESGLELHPIILLISQWGNKWLAPEGNLIEYIHQNKVEHTMKAKLVCEECEDEIHPKDIRPEIGEGLSKWIENATPETLESYYDLYFKEKEE